MKKTKFIEAQIVIALRQAYTGVSISEVCHKMSISETALHNWK
jgi:putative transposase